MMIKTKYIYHLKKLTWITNEWYSNLSYQYLDLNALLKKMPYNNPNVNIKISLFAKLKSEIKKKDKNG